MFLGARASRPPQGALASPSDPRALRNFQEEFFDLYIRDQQHFQGAAEYIGWNPVKAGLCELEQPWRFGSATLRAGGTPALPGDQGRRSYSRPPGGIVTLFCEIHSASGGGKRFRIGSCG